MLTSRATYRLDTILLQEETELQNSTAKKGLMYVACGMQSFHFVYSAPPNITTSPNLRPPEIFNSVDTKHAIDDRETTP